MQGGRIFLEVVKDKEASSLERARLAGLLGGGLRAAAQKDVVGADVAAA